MRNEESARLDEDGGVGTRREIDDDDDDDARRREKGSS
jgi:hypothetical protein|tara:strand:- start:897 stop:1010 length:114 start_codon:yes stop_codon:yes gene_type:complete